MNNRLIAQFNKNSVEVVKISEAWFKGKRYFDIRIWVQGENPAEPGTEQPTKKGICLSVDLLPEFFEAIDKLREFFNLNFEEKLDSGEQKRAEDLEPDRMPF